MGGTQRLAGVFMLLPVDPGLIERVASSEAAAGQCSGFRIVRRGGIGGRIDACQMCLDEF